MKEKQTEQRIGRLSVLGILVLSGVSNAYQMNVIGNAGTKYVTPSPGESYNTYSKEAGKADALKKCQELLGDRSVIGMGCITEKAFPGIMGHFINYRYNAKCLNVDLNPREAAERFSELLMSESAPHLTKGRAVNELNNIGIYNAKILENSASLLGSGYFPQKLFLSAVVNGDEFALELLVEKLHAENPRTRRATVIVFDFLGYQDPSKLENVLPVLEQRYAQEVSGEMSLGEERLLRSIQMRIVSVAYRVPEFVSDEFIDLVISDMSNSRLAWTHIYSGENSDFGVPGSNLLVALGERALPKLEQALIDNKAGPFMNYKSHFLNTVDGLGVVAKSLIPVLQNIKEQWESSSVRSRIQKTIDKLQQS